MSLRIDLLITSSFKIVEIKIWECLVTHSYWNVGRKENDWCLNGNMFLILKNDRYFWTWWVKNHANLILHVFFIYWHFKFFLRFQNLNFLKIIKFQILSVHQYNEFQKFETLSLRIFLSLHNFQIFQNRYLQN